jgi:hypothetical protein
MKSTIGLGWVYVVTHANAKGLCKIGITRNPANRKDQLGGDDLTVMAMLFNWNPERAETRLHQKYKAVRVPQSEWFNLTADQVEEVIADLQSQHDQVMAYVVSPRAVAWPLNPAVATNKWKPEEPKWDSLSRVWRYTNRVGDACTANSRQEAVNNQ